MSLKTDLATTFSLEAKELYLTKHSTACDGTKCCECLGMLESHFIFHPEDEKTKEGEQPKRKIPLKCFDRKNELKDIEPYMKKIPYNRRILNEVIPAEIPRKIFVDVDDGNLAEANKALVESKNKKDWDKYVRLFRDLMRVVVYNIKMVLVYKFNDEEGYNIDYTSIKDSDFAYYISNGWDEKEKRFKASAHVVLQTYYIHHVDHGKVFERTFKEYMKDVKHFKYDPKLNSQTNLRTVHNHKIGSTRDKVIPPTCPYQNFIDSLITYTEGRKLILPNNVDDDFDNKRDYTNVKANISIRNLDILFEHLADKKIFVDYTEWSHTCHSISDFTNHSEEGFDLFDKWSRIHGGEKYNVLTGRDDCRKEWVKFETINKEQINANVGYILKFVDRNDYIKMRRMMFPDEDIRRAEEQKVLRDTTVHKFKFTRGENVEIKEIDEKDLTKDVYETKKEMSTIAVRSGMATRKTVALVEDYLKPKMDANNGTRILWLTHRISLTNQTSKMFDKRMVNYKQKEGALTDQYLMVQIESVMRISEKSRTFDIIIIDEFIAFINHMKHSGYMTFNAKTICEEILRNGKQLIVMDAQLDDDSLRQIYFYRKLKIDVIHNTYLNTKPIYVMFDNETLLMGKMLKVLKRGLKIVVPTTSKATADIVFDLIADMLKNNKLKKKMAIYTADSDDSTKQKHFEDVNKYWAKLDIVIFTPTCSEGVSFTKANFDCVFGYFHGESACAETARQMCHRVRNITTNKYYIYIKHIPGNKDIITEKYIEDAIKREGRVFRGDNFKYQKEKGLIGQVSTGTIGEGIVYQKTPWYNSYILYLKRELLSLTAFYEIFVRLARESGATVKQSKFKISAKTTNEIKNTVKVVRREIKDKKLTAIANADDIDADEAGALKLQILKSKEDKNKLAKHYLRELGYKGEITVDVMKKYPKSIKSIHNTLKYVNLNTAKADFDWCREHFKLEHETYQLRDQTTKMLYRIHIALQLLKLCGFGEKRIKSRNIAEDELLKVFKSKDVMSMMTGTHHESKQLSIMIAFAKKRTFTKEQLEAKTIKPWLQFVNSILKATFDCCIKKVNKHSDEYMLAFSDRFGAKDDQIPFPLTKRVDEMYGKKREKKRMEQMIAVI